MAPILPNQTPPLQPNANAGNQYGAFALQIPYSMQNQQSFMQPGTGPNGLPGRVPMAGGINDPNNPYNQWANTNRTAAAQGMDPSDPRTMAAAQQANWTLNNQTGQTMQYDPATGTYKSSGGVSGDKYWTEMMKGGERGASMQVYDPRLATQQLREQIYQDPRYLAQMQQFMDAQNRYGAAINPLQQRAMGQNMYSQLYGQAAQQQAQGQIAQQAALQGAGRNPAMQRMAMMQSSGIAGQMAPQIAAQAAQERANAEQALLQARLQQQQSGQAGMGMMAGEYYNPMQAINQQNAITGNFINGAQGGGGPSAGQIGAAVGAGLGQGVGAVGMNYALGR